MERVESLERATGEKLLWQLMELLLEQNGKVVGGDISELLLCDEDDLDASIVSSRGSSTSGECK